MTGISTAVATTTNARQSYGSIAEKIAFGSDMRETGRTRNQQVEGRPRLMCGLEEGMMLQVKVLMIKKE